MKPIHILFLALLAAAAVVIGGCSWQQEAPGWGDCEGGELKDDALLGTGCWSDRHTYRVFAVSAPAVKAKTLKERHDTARDAAVLVAKMIFLKCISVKRDELIKKSLPPNAQSVNYTDANSPAKAFKSALAGGIIVEEICAPDDSCRVLYEIREKNLKKSVEDYLKAYKTP